MSKRIPTFHAVGSVGSWWVDIQDQGVTVDRLPACLNVYVTKWPHYKDTNADQQFADGIRAKGKVALSKSCWEGTSVVKRDGYIAVYSVANVTWSPQAGVEFIFVSRECNLR